MTISRSPQISQLIIIDESNKGIINKNTGEHNSSIGETIQIGKGGLKKSQKPNKRNSKQKEKLSGSRKTLQPNPCLSAKCQNKCVHKLSEDEEKKFIKYLGD